MWTIRPAVEGDVPGLVLLARRAWVSGFTDAPAGFVTDWLTRDFEAGWYPRHWPDMFVAEEEGVLLGLVQPVGDEVNGLWVDPAAQGRGVGTALLRHAEGMIAAAGHPRAWLTCSAFNPRGCRFYLARGYREILRESKPRAGGVTEEMRTYERDLSSRDPRSSIPLSQGESHEAEVSMAKSTPSKPNLPPPPYHRLTSVFDDPPRQNVFLLTCMDQRLLDDTVRFMNTLNLQNRYDQISLAGGAMGVNRLSSESTAWKPVFFHHLRVAIDTLQRPIKDVFLLDHLDCGAYKFLHPTEAANYESADLAGMRDLHRHELVTLAREVTEYIDTRRQNEAWKGIRVSCLLMDVRGQVTQFLPDVGEETVGG